MNWWNDLWLNEGFASFLEIKGQNHVNNLWNVFDLFSISHIHPALLADSQQSTHPLVNTVLTPNQITAMFDTISYRKGAAILNTIESIIGENSFQSCLRKYLNNNKFSSVNTTEMVNYVKDEIKEVCVMFFIIMFHILKTKNIYR